MADDRVTIRVPEDVLARLDDARGSESRSGWILAALGRQLDGGGPAVPGPAPAAPAGRQETCDVPAGSIPCPGVACMWPACWARDTSRYGVTDPGELARTDYRARPRDEDKVGLPLCPAHAAKLAGLIYRRPAAPARGAA